MATAVAAKDDMEEGELSSDGEEEALGGYTPLERPVVARPGQQTAPLSDLLDSDSDSDVEAGGPLLGGGDSDSDSERPAAKQRRAGLWGRRDALVVGEGGGETFRRMAQQFQEDREARGLNTKKKKYNVWANLIQEESLNSEMTGALVGGKNLKELNSDRGAETYDYTLIAAERAKERQKEEANRKKGKKTERSTSLDDEMDSYWSQAAAGDGETSLGSDQEEVTAGASMDQSSKEQLPAVEGDEKRGTKRSVKDRLGDRRVRLDRYKDAVLAAPGKPVTIPDIAEEDLLEGTDQEFGRLLADRLSEEKEEMIVSLVGILGRQVALQFFRETQRVEREGGMVINNGARRRTAGGVMMHLLRKCEDQSIRQPILKFFNESQKQDHKRRIAVAKSKTKKKFEDEMQDFLKRKKELAEEKKDNSMEAEDAEEDEELKPLPNILSNIADLFGAGEKDSVKPTVTRVSSFKEPEAPPNSVERAEAERALLEYDEDEIDFLSKNADTEDIELF